MSLLLAQIAGAMEREILEKLISGLVPNREYLLHFYRRKGEPSQEPISGTFIQKYKGTIVFDKFILTNYTSYNSMLDAISGAPIFSLNGKGIADIIEVV